LFDPPMDKETAPLWLAPFALLLIGGGVLVYQLRKRQRAIAETETELTPEAAQRAAQLLNEQKDTQA